MLRCFALLLASMLPTTIFAATAPDLRSRISIDGNLSDFTADERVVDDATNFPENPGDSRWGNDHDVSTLSVTWDIYNIYIGVNAVTSSGHLMLVLDTTCGGLSDLSAPGPFERNVVFSRMEPNVIVSASRSASSPVTLATTRCDVPFATADPAQYEAVYVQNGNTDGALEIAIPWALAGDFTRSGGALSVPAGGVTLRVAAFITGGIGTGAGDAIPDPSARLETDSTRVATLNNHAALALDANGDGFLDMGVMPRNDATFPVTQAESTSGVLPLRLVLQNKVAQPGTGTPLSFYATLDGSTSRTAYLTARVYAANGRLVREIYEDVSRDLSSGAPPVIDTWDGRDSDGRIAPGGVYVLAVSAGIGPSAPGKTVTASFAVVR